MGVVELIVLFFLDDGLDACPTFDSALQQSSSVRADLVNCSFLPSELKCIWFPTQNIQWLGLDWDLKQQLLCIPMVKIDHLLVAVSGALAREKKFSQKAGIGDWLIMSNVLVFSNICQFMSKALHRVVETRTTWNSCVKLDSHARQELQFWKTEVHKFNSCSLIHKLSVPTRFLYSDASNSGCAGFISLDECPIFYKNLAAIGMQQSSTCRELQCINYALDSFKNLFSSYTVKWFTDNQCVPKILKGGSTKEHPQKNALEIYYCTRKNEISLEAEWVPRD